MRKIRFMYIRLLIYILSIIILLFVYNGHVQIKCYFYEMYHIQCPACGLTRAVINIIKFKFVDAFNFNKFFTLVLAPFIIFIIVEDMCVIFKRLLFKKKSVSLVEILLGDNKIG
ncbi:MAG TPA: DUF2752 domain-containing protein [Clostridiaceae bacterium]|nr:DUF2752 domain-containing protein [Clostridiaceae bacterium]